MAATPEVSADAGMKLAYSELRRLAAGYLRGQPRGRTLEPAALVNEAYIRLAAWDGVHWQSRSHFIGVAAMVMRQVIWIHARRRNALKRGAGAQAISLHADAIPAGSPLDAFLFENALQRLEAESASACRIVEMRVFGGLTISEIATVLGSSESTVKRQWLFAKTWLKRQLDGDCSQ
ncbi:MAG: RNA polymerase subunit sigma-70 [Acidobacteria bacterium]|nr:RNA polymerase subunit sigma-70 [Acidobacteriota bacterium]